MIRFPGDQVAQYLHDKYGFDVARAIRTVQVAAEYGLTKEPTDSGVVTVRLSNKRGIYTIENWVSKKSSADSRSGVARKAPAEYACAPNNRSTTRPTRPTTRRTTEMAPRGRSTKAAPAPEPEVDESEDTGYTAYADKDATATMVDFADWLIEEVFGGEYKGDEDDFRNGVRLGGTLRMEFQRSDFNIERREARKAEREQEAAAKAKAAKAKPAKAEADEDEDEEAPAPKAGRGRKPATTSSSSTSKPAAGRRKPAAAKGEALY